MQLIFDTIKLPRVKNKPQDAEILKNNAEFLKREIACAMKDLRDCIEHNQYSFTIIYPSKGYKVLVDYSNIKEMLVNRILDKELKGYVYKGNVSELSDYF